MTADLRGLGYLGLETADLTGWTEYATEVLGLMVAAHSSESVTQLKMDELPHRVTVSEGTRDGLAYAGWETAGPKALEALAEKVVEAGVAVHEAKPDELELRRVQGMLWCDDPSGIRVEFYHTPIHDHQRFVSPIGVRSFVTGDQGMGHIVLLCDHWEESCAFYQDVLGFRLSDSMLLGGMSLRFLRCNPRHHSLALAPHHSSRLAHLMIEVDSLDDVGACIDRCAERDVPIATSLGRHTNDHMISFYMRAPKGFEVEYGFGGRRVDEATWTPSEITQVSFWGHVRAGH